MAAADVDRRDRGSRRRRRRGADAGEVGEQPQPGGARLLGVELDAEDVVALDRAGEALAVGGGAEQLARRRGAGRRSGRSRRASRRRSPRPAGTSRSQRTGDQPMWGTLRPPASSSVDLARRAGRARGAPPSSVEESKSSCRPRQMPRIGTPARVALGDQLVEAELADPLHRPREGADAGQDRSPSAARAALGVGGDQRRSRRRARAPSRPSAGCPSRSRGSRCAARSARSGFPWCEGTPVSSGSIETATRSARAKALKQASIMWWALVPERTADVQGQLGAVGDGAEELLRQLGVEAGDRGRRQIGVEGAVGAARRCRSRTRPSDSSIGTSAEP